MTLPVIPDLPIPPLPVEIPLLMHPVVAHFAIAIPAIVLLLELVNLIARKRAISVTSIAFLFLAMFVYVGLFLTGKTDGSEGYALLNETAQADFKAHKLMGLYLIYATAVVFVVKALAMMIKHTAAKVLFIVILIAFVSFNMLQGKSGGNLVYHHGMNVAATSEANELAEDLQDEAEDLNAKIEELTAEVEKLNVEKDNLKCKEVQESIEAVMAQEPATDAQEAVEKVQDAVDEETQAEADVEAIDSNQSDAEPAIEIAPEDLNKTAEAA
jgi:uncharacterized membrane protein